MRVEVEVTQEDLEQGTPGDCSYCPVARAFERALGYAVEVGQHTFWRRPLRDPLLGLGEVYQLPVKVQAFIKGFDDANTRDDVTPFKFTVEAPE